MLYLISNQSRNASISKSIINANDHLISFVKLSHVDYPSWNLGWSTYLKQFCSWSDSSTGPGQFKQMDTIQELRNLYTWFLSKQYVNTMTFDENIAMYG